MRTHVSIALVRSAHQEHLGSGVGVIHSARSELSRFMTCPITGHCIVQDECSECLKETKPPYRCSVNRLNAHSEFKLTAYGDPDSAQRFSLVFLANRTASPLRLFSRNPDSVCSRGSY